MDCSPSGSSVHRSFWARILECPGTDRGRRPSQRPSSAFRGTEGTPARPFGFSQRSALPAGKAARNRPGRGRHRSSSAAVTSWTGGAGAWSLAAPSPGIPARAGLGFRGRLPVGRGPTAPPSSGTGWNLLATGWARDGGGRARRRECRGALWYNSCNNMIRGPRAGNGGRP